MRARDVRTRCERYKRCDSENKRCESERCESERCESERCKHERSLERSIDARDVRDTRDARARAR